jgi:hypothetical protein
MIVIYADDTTQVSLHVQPDGTDAPAFVLRSIASLPVTALSAGNPRPTVRRRRIGPVTALVLAIVAAASGYIAGPRGPTPVPTGAAFAASSTGLNSPQIPGVPPTLQHELEGRPSVTPPPEPAAGNHTRINPFGLQP